MSSTEHPPSSFPSGPPSWAAEAARPRLGRFVLGPELGRGGMGHVHAAWDPMLRRQVALKLLHQGDPIQLLRFMREAQIQAKVEHPQVCKVFEVGSEGDQPYIAMQFIAGRTLGDMKNELSVRDLARIMSEVAGAVHAAHRLGLIHRDLKPANILLEAQEHAGLMPYVLDFGLARDQSVADQTLSWGFVGTPAFMSPEQSRAEEPTPASDIYSLGATFYALFAGRPPFEATSMVGLAAQQSTTLVRSLRRDDATFPRDLDTIVLKCLDPEPKGRYASAWELEEELRRWLAGEPILARPIGPLERAWWKVKQRKALSLAIATGLLMTLTLLAWNAYAARQSRLQIQLAQTFALQVREVEQLLRIERMLPPHDIRPAEGQVRTRMTEIRLSMAKLGKAALGPGHYALGRGHLALRENVAARGKLELAWQAGFRTPEVAYALGTVLLNLYLIEQEKLTLTDSALIEVALQPLRATLVEPALAYFQLVQGQAQENPAYGEAQVAMLLGDHGRCIERCRAAYAAKPWMHEAKLLEAKALRNSVFGTPGYRGSSKEVEAHLQEAAKAIQVASGIAHSDEMVQLTELALLTSLSYYQADSGTPTAEVFDHSEALFQQALTIRPEDAQLTRMWLHSRVRQGSFLLGLGRDVRPLMWDTLRRTQAGGSAVAAGVDADAVGHLYTMLAEGQWHLGEDPLPALAEADRRFQPEAFGRTQPLRTRVDILLDQGRSPLATLDDGEQLLQNRMSTNDWSFWHESVYGMFLLARAEWAWQQGQDPRQHLDQAVQHLETSRQMSPETVYAHFLLAQAHTFKARRALALGLDPQHDLVAAEQAGLRGLRVTASHYRVHLALAAVQEAQALALMERKLDPTPSLVLARRSVAAGLKVNPTDFRLHLEGARIELEAAQHAIGQQASPLPALDEAEANARKGLAIKGNSAQLWTAVAKAERLRAAWGQQHPNTVKPGRTAAGLLAIQRALACNPRLPIAQAEQALLALLQSGGEVQKRNELDRLLQQNRFLAWEYRAQYGHDLPTSPTGLAGGAGGR